MVKLEGIGFREGRKVLLDGIDLTISPGECLFITGNNGSGKTLLGNILAGVLAPTAGTVTSESRPAHVSFERQEAVMAEERLRDESRFLDGNGAENPGRSLEEWVREGRNCSEEEDYLREILSKLGLERLKERGLRYLSTGEFRKTMTARALWEKADFMIFDDPYDGLDRQAAAFLKEMIHLFIQEGNTVALLSGKKEDIPEGTDRMVILEKGQIVFSGSLDEGLSFHDASRSLPSGKTAPYSTVSHRDRDGSAGPLISLSGVSVAYGEKKILSRLDWRIDRGDKWLLSGPNGAGKSTLLSLINGDNAKAYGQEIILFGTKKGSGESVWDIKERIGHVSGDFQLNYRVRTSVLGVILSGYYDSIGLYSRFSEQQKQTALGWMEFCGLKDRKKVSFEELSFGEKRMALIARSLIKSPELLILDEPCQGLDDAHRESVLALCAELCRIDDLTMLYVTHSDASTPVGLSHHLNLVPCDGGGFTGSLT